MQIPASARLTTAAAGLVNRIEYKCSPFEFSDIYCMHKQFVGAAECSMPRYLVARKLKFEAS